jgi:hypothetical protein
MGAMSPAALFLHEHQAKKTSASALSAVQVRPEPCSCALGRVVASPIVRGGGGGGEGRVEEQPERPGGGGA